MTMLSVVPQEFFDGVPVPGAVSLDGELLGTLEDAPAGPWLAELLARVDRSRLTTFELPTYLRECQRMASWANAQLAAGVVELASRADAVGPEKDIALARCGSRSAPRSSASGGALADVLRRHARLASLGFASAPPHTGSLGLPPPSTTRS